MWRSISLFEKSRLNLTLCQVYDANIGVDVVEKSSLVNVVGTVFDRNNTCMVKRFEDFVNHAFKWNKFLGNQDCL